MVIIDAVGIDVLFRNVALNVATRLGHVSARFLEEIHLIDTPAMIGWLRDHASAVNSREGGRRFLWPPSWKPTGRPWAAGLASCGPPWL